MGEGPACAKTLWQDGSGIELKGSDIRLEKQKEADDTAHAAQLRRLDFIPRDLEVIKV